MPADTVTVDREALVEFLVEIDAVAAHEIILAGNVETPIVEHIYRLLETFENSVFGGSLTDSDELHGRAHERGRELVRDLYQLEAVTADG